MKWLFRFLLSLCFLLSAIYGHPHGLVYVKQNKHASIDRLPSEHIEAGGIRNNPIVAPARSRHHRRHGTPEATAGEKKEEKDEDEEEKSKKFSASLNYFSVFYHAQTAGNIHDHVKQYTACGGHLLLLSNSRYIILRVFRI
jgi:hypothetical protein